MKNPILLISISLVSVIEGMGQAKREIIPASKGTIQYGIASYYSDKFEGKPTSSGEKFSQQKMTAAHNSLPLGTWLRVTNLRNHRSVVVRVNDRLHHRNTRLVDLSSKAASTLGYLKRGIAKVKVEVLGTKKPEKEEENEEIKLDK